MAENAVVASPYPVRGEIIKACIVLVPGFKPSDGLAREIQEFVKKKTAPYRYPREIEFMTELPKTLSGKVRRAVLRSREVERKMGRYPKIRKRGIFFQGITLGYCNSAEHL